MKVFYTEKQNSEQGEQNLEGAIKSPSSRKPQEVAEALRQFSWVEFVEPQPLTRDDFKLAHDPGYVDRVMNLEEENGFGSISQSVVDSLPYTNGAMYDAAKAATDEQPTCALVSGFHHAGYYGWRHLGYFCTFNGLIIAAHKLLNEGKKTVAILDLDMHWGNGTDDILRQREPMDDRIVHLSFGRKYNRPRDAFRYLGDLEINGKVREIFEKTKPDVILYQAGADVHVDDPYGGVLTTEQMLERDEKVFTIAKTLGIPIAWNLAGGYQIGPNGQIDKVIELHLNTFRAYEKVYGSV